MASTIEKLMNRKNGGDKKPDSTNETVSSSLQTNVASDPAQPHSKQFVSLNRADLAASGYIVQDAKSETVEEYRLIKRRLLKGVEANKKLGVDIPNMVLVTSALQGDGKTFTALNLALSLSMEMDRTALLIDGDVMKSGVSRTLDIASDAGFVDLLTNQEQEFSELLFKTDVPNLSILPSGKSGMRATELFSSDRMKAVCQEISNRYPDRIIIIDSPPLLQTTESQALAQIIPNIVFVVSASHTPTTAISNAMELLDKEKNINFVLNKVRLNGSGMYYYYNTEA